MESQVGQLQPTDYLAVSHLKPAKLGAWTVLWVGVGLCSDLYILTHLFLNIIKEYLYIYVYVYLFPHVNKGNNLALSTQQLCKQSLLLSLP